MGAFDDLIPRSNANGGAFDDLIPAAKPKRKRGAVDVVEDLAKGFGGAAVSAVGAVPTAFGRAIREGGEMLFGLSMDEAKRLAEAEGTPEKALEWYEKANRLNPVSVAGRAIESGGRWISEKGDSLREARSDEAKELARQSTPDGDLTRPSTWTMGENPSVEGVAQVAADVVGNMAPPVATAIATRGRSAATQMRAGGATVAGQIAGSAMDEAGGYLGQFSDEQLRQVSPVFRDLEARGYSAADARTILEREAENRAAAYAAPVGYAGGKATAALLGKPGEKLAGQFAGTIPKAIVLGTLGATEEGLQEISEGIATRAGINDAAGTDRSLTEGTFGEFVLGAKGGGVTGAGKGVIEGLAARRRPPANPAAPAPDEGGSTPAFDGARPTSAPATTVTATAATAPAPAAASPAATPATDPTARLAELEILSEQRDLTPAERQETIDLLTALQDEQDAPQGSEGVAPQAPAVEAPEATGGDGAAAAGVPAEPSAPNVEAAGLEPEREAAKRTNFWTWIGTKGYKPADVKVGTPLHADLKAEFDALRNGQPLPSKAQPAAPSVDPVAAVTAWRERFPAKPPSGMSEEQLHQFAGERRNAEAQLVQQLEPQANGLVLPTATGFGGITQDPSEAGKWRITRFDAAMEPVGHEVYNSAREAIENLLPRFQAPQAKQAEPILPPMQPQPSVDLQNRDRSRAASVVQMSDIARNPDYMRLGPSRTPDSGAPMVFAVGDQLDAIAPENFGRQDVAVMSDGQRVPFRYAVVDATKVNPSNFADGRQNPDFNSTTPGTIKALNNGRTAGVRAAHEMGTAGEYVAGMQADEAMHGIPADVIARTPNPMLVRVYSDAANTANMAAKSQGQGLGMSPAELARQDAPLMDSSVLGVYEPGEITSAANRDFVRAFIGKLQAAGQDVAGMMTGDGQLSQDGRKRIQAALMQAAYGDSDIVEEMFDSTDTDIKAIGEALKTLAGQWANMRDSAKLGAINPQTDITQNLIQAIGLIRKARRDGTMLYDLVNQPDLMTGETPDATTVGVLRMFYSGQYMTRAVGKDKLTKSLSDYVTAAMATSADPGMFGDVVTAGEILATINPITEGQSDAEAQPEEGRGQPAGSGDPGVGVGEARTAVGRQRAGESGAGVAADRGSEPGQDAAPEAQQQVGQGDPRAEEGDGAAAARAGAGQQEGADGRAAAAEGRAGAADGQAVKAKKPKKAAKPKAEPDALPADQAQQLERDFRTFPTQILNNLLERGEAAKLYKAAGVKGASAFGDLAMDDKAAAYVKFVQQGGKPVENLPKDYNAWVKSEERAAEVRRLQSDRVVRQENGKPFKSKTSAQQYQERYDLTGTHEVVAVDGGFELRQLSPAAQAELKRKAEGRESYTEAQAAVAEEMGIGQTPDGEWDATDEQFDEMERRVQARMRGEPAEPLLTNPTREDVLAQQERAENAQAADEREQIRRESEAGAGTFSLEMQDGRQDTTADLFRQTAAERAQAAPAAEAATDVEQQSAIERHGLPEGTTFSRGKGMASGKWIARAGDTQGNLSATIDEAASSLAQFLQLEKRREENTAAMVALSKKVADKLRRGEQPTDVELRDLFGLDPRHTYVKQSAVGQFLVDYMGVPRNKIRESLGAAAGDVTSDGGVKYPVVYPRKLHQVFADKVAPATAPEQVPAEASRPAADDGAAATAEVEGSQKPEAPNYSLAAGIERSDSKPTTSAWLRAALTRGALGEVIDTLLSRGAVVLHERPASLPVKNVPRNAQAVTLPDGTIHLVARGLRPQTAQAVLLHEAFHQGGERLIGTKAWAALMRRLDSLYRQAERSSGRAREFFDAARARVQAARSAGVVSDAMTPEEFGAYTIEQYEQAPAAFRKWVDDLIGAVKAWLLRRFGIQAGQVTPAQLRALAVAALRDQAGVSLSSQFSGAQVGAMTSQSEGINLSVAGLPDTIEVDGVQRPTRNSAGRPIHPTKGGIRNFWRWFGDSKVVDEQGRPLVVYHGTAGDFDTFDMSKLGDSTGNTGFYGAGAYFTQDTKDASSYAGWAVRTDEQRPSIYPAYLSIQSPLLLHANPKTEADRATARASIGKLVEQIVKDGRFGRNPDASEAGSQYATVMSHIERGDFERAMGYLHTVIGGGEGITSYAQRAGFDGVLVYRNNDDGSRVLAEAVAFSPEQIKSATGNNGDFDPANPDIRFSLSTLGNTPPTPPQNPNAWQKLKAKALELTSPDAIESLIYEYQDKNIDLKRLRDHIKELGGTITDLNDAYLGEELYHKRLAKRTQDFLSEELKPLLADMRARGVDMPTLERYLHARHAPEANRVLAERNPNAQMIEAGKAKAQAEVKALEVQLQRARAQGTATKAIEQALEQAMAERDRWTGAQAFKGTEAERLSLSGMSDAEAAAFMGGLPAGQKVHLEALAARVDAMQAKTLEVLEKYGLMDKATLDAWRSTYQFYVPLHRDEAHPDAVSHPIGQGFSTKGDASKRRTGSNEKVTNILAHIAMQREAALTRGEKNRVAKKLYLMAAQNPDPEIWSVDKPPMMKTVDRETGFVRTTVDPTYRNKPNVVMVRIGGKDHAITFNERNQKAVRMAQSIKDADVGDLNAFESIMGKATRWLASVNTQYNPIFGIFNFARDVQAAILQLSTTPLKGQERAVAAYVPAALKGIYAEVRSRRKGQARGTGQWAKLWEDMQDEGGTTGYRELFITPDERVKALTKELNALERGKASEAAHAVVDWLSDYNETMENAVRLAAYKVALDQGMSKERAASLAKNLTVNFNRRGRQTARLGAYYAFLNAAIQGTTRMVETLRGPLGRKIMLGGVMLGAVNALIGMAMMGGDDDEEDNWEKIPDFVKERSLIIPLGREDYLAIPMPLGYHVFPNLGRKAVEMMMHDDPTKGVGSHIAEMLRITLDAFNPLGGSENLAQMVTPTPFDPAVALMMNRDWTGKPIYREDNSNLDPTPGHQRTKDTASAFSKAVSEALNKITGGTDYQPGAVSVTPDQIDYVIGQITGGLGREILKLENTITAPLTGDELPAYKMPLAGRLYGNTRGTANNAELFYEHVRELNKIENEIRGRARDGGDVAGYMAEEPLSALVGMGNAAENQIRKLRQYRAEVVRRAEPGYQDEVKRINEQMGEVMKMLNQEVRRAKMEAADAP